MNQTIEKDLISDISKRDQTLANFEIAILSIIFILIVVGNVAVIIALVSARIKIQRMYYFLLHLSISDLLTAFCNVLPQLIWEITVRFYGDNFLCKFVKYIQLLGPYLSSYVLVFTAIDRYQSICFPLANCTWTERRSKIMITFAWIIALICCLPQAFIFSYVRIAWTTYPNSSSSYKILDKPDNKNDLYTVYYNECWGTFIKPWGEKIYVLWYAISVFFVPLIILSFTYFNICKVIWINARIKRKNMKESKSNLIFKKTKKFFKNNSNKNIENFKNSQDEEIVFLKDKYNVYKHNVLISSNSEKTLNNTKTKLSLFNARSNANANKLSKAKFKTIKVTLVVIICYISCSLPFCFVQLWAHWWPEAQSSSLWNGPLITITMLLPSLNSCVNPWIYLLLNRNLLYTLLNLIFGPKCVKNPIDGHLSTSIQKTTTYTDYSKANISNNVKLTEFNITNNNLVTIHYAKTTKIENELKVEFLIKNYVESNLIKKNQYLSRTKSEPNLSNKLMKNISISCSDSDLITIKR